MKWPSEFRSCLPGYPCLFGVRSYTHLTKLILSRRKSCLPICRWNLVLLKKVHADVTLVDLSSTDDAHIRVHHNIVGDWERLKTLAELINLGGVVMIQQILLLWEITNGIKMGAWTYIAIKAKICWNLIEILEKVEDLPGLEYFEFLLKVSRLLVLKN